MDTTEREKKARQFAREYQALCKKHGFAVSSDGYGPSVIYEINDGVGDEDLAEMLKLIGTLNDPASCPHVYRNIARAFEPPRYGCVLCGTARPPQSGTP